MHVLVTGIGGFIAPHVARKLHDSGHTVTGLDLKPLEDEPYPVLAIDLLEVETLKKVLQGVDAVCHLAGVGDVYLAAADPLLAVRLNVEATTNLVLCAAEVGVEKIVFASTWEVYGESLYQPLDEAHPCSPGHPYSITKLAAEQMGLSLGHSLGLAFISLRLGTAYGPGLRPNSVFRIFIEKAKKGEPLTIQGTGEQYRQFTHVSDVAAAFSAACESGTDSDVFNIVASERVTILDLADRVVKSLGGSINHDSSRVAEVPPALVSSEKVHRLLDWSPEVNFSDGLNHLIRHYSN